MTFVQPNNGIPPYFVDDEYQYYDEAKGLWQTVGLPDLGNGYELKTLDNAGINSVDKYLRKTRKSKKGVSAIVVDNFENKSALSDAELIDYLRTTRRWNSRLYIITRDGSFLRMK